MHVRQNAKAIQVNGMPYERVGILGKGGSSKVYSVLCPINRTIYALKRVALDRADAETYQSYTNEIELLKRLRGHDRIIQLIDHQITFSQANRPKMLMMVCPIRATYSNLSRSWNVGRLISPPYWTSNVGKP